MNIIYGGINMKYGEVLKGRDVEGKEKHVPIIEVENADNGKNIVKVTVGKEVPHPNTVEHHICWIQLYGVKKDNNQVVELGRTDFGPTFTDPITTFKISLDGIKTLIALEYCNIHGVWEDSLNI